MTKHGPSWTALTCDTYSAQNGRTWTWQRRFSPGRDAQIEDAVVDASLYGSFDMVDGDVPSGLPRARPSNYSVARTLVSHKRRSVASSSASTAYRRRSSAFVAARTAERFWTKQIHGMQMPSRQELRVVNKVMMRVRLAHMTVGDLLWEGPSPYRHNRFRFTPIWCYRRGRADNLPYGMIRPIRDIQDDINKRASKALHILSSNKVIMDEGALPDGTTIDELRRGNRPARCNHRQATRKRAGNQCGA